MKNKIIYLTASDLAKEANEDVRTVRFWIEQGVIPSDATTKSGWQLFMQEKVSFVKRIQELRDTKHYTLEGIKKELLK